MTWINKDLVRKVGTIFLQDRNTKEEIA